MSRLSLPRVCPCRFLLAVFHLLIPLVDPHDLTLQSSTIISMIPKLTHCQSVYVSTKNPSVLSALKSGDLSPEEIKETICMDESTVEMEGSRAVAQAIEATGAGMVDAPVSGGTLVSPPPLPLLRLPKR